MKRHIVSLFLALILCMALAVPALAGGNSDLPYPYLSVAEQIDGEDQICPLSEDGSGNGWSWDAATATLTLDNYDGGAIQFNGFYMSDLAIHLVLKGSSRMDGAFWCYKFGTPGKQDNSTIDISGDGSLVITGDMNCTNMFTGDYTITDADGEAADFEGTYFYNIKYPVTVSCVGSALYESGVSGAISDGEADTDPFSPIRLPMKKNAVRGISVAAVSPRSQPAAFLYRAFDD